MGGNDLPDCGGVLHEPGQNRWLRFRHPVTICAAHAIEDVLPTLREVEGRVECDGLHAAGFISYEAAPAFDPALRTQHDNADFPLVWFGLYNDPEVLDELPAPSGEASIPEWSASVSDPDYAEAIKRVRAYIAAGDTYQVNYTFRLRAPAPERPWELFLQLVDAQGPGHAAFIDTGDWAICSASPELFLALDGEVLTSRPMKGTIGRGARLRDDLEQRARLHASEKDRAENVMIVDMVRNDLGRVARQGTVEVSDLFKVERYPTLWQMTSTVSCATDAPLADVLAATFPPASITGAPKARTMEIIAELEDTPRRVYTGAVGFIAPGRRAQFNVAIRTVLVDKRGKNAEYGVGGGIVWDSGDAAELAECRTKALILKPWPEFRLLESLLWTPQDEAGDVDSFFLLDLHLKRLAESSVYFGFRRDFHGLVEALLAEEAGFPPRPQKVRVLVARDGTYTIEAADVPPLPDPYRLRLAARPIDSSDLFLYHKTTHRRAYDDASAAVDGADDVLLWNERGEVTESCIANVAVELDDELLTPPVECGLLAGTYRAELLRQGRVKERVIHLDDLPRCSKVFLMNAVRGMWEVCPHQ